MMMTALFWLMVVASWINLASSWLFRRRLKAQHKMMVELYRELAKRRRDDAEKWSHKAKEASLTALDRQLAYGHAMGAIGNAIACDDIAADIEHLLVNGKSLSSRTTTMNEERARLEREAKDTIVFTSKGGDA
jgi:hypothetical protein